MNDQPTIPPELLAKLEYPDGPLQHLQEPSRDWGCIADGSGRTMLRVNLPLRDRTLGRFQVENACRSLDIDPTKQMSDRVVARYNACIGMERPEEEIAALRAAVEVLAIEVAHTRQERERFFGVDSHAAWAASVKAAGEAAVATNAHPIAAAAIQAAEGKQGPKS